MGESSTVVGAYTMYILHQSLAFSIVPIALSYRHFICNEWYVSEADLTHSLHGYSF